MAETYHHVTIKAEAEPQPGTRNRSQITLDGVPLRRVRSYSVECDALTPTLVTVSFYAYVNLETPDLQPELLTDGA